VEVEGKEPSSKHLVALINRARKQGVKVIFVQPQFSTKSAEAIATAIGGTVVALDPLAHDYIRNLEEMAQKIKDASF
jgi:zinc transport system substrate-binding protein